MKYMKGILQENSENNNHNNFWLIHFNREIFITSVLIILVFTLWWIYYMDGKKSCGFAKACIWADKYGIVIDVPEIGQLRGIQDNTSWTNEIFFKFMGIPYGEPPVGKLRFKPPIPRHNWPGIKDVTKYGKRCPTINNITLKNQKYLFSEDCLKLCVYTKDFMVNRPVMVYIYANGSATDYSGKFLLEKEIVYVTVEFRFGILGFISTHTPEIPGNMGIHDVKLALEWIQKNINYFGGNPNDVTVFGHSNSAEIISLLMISPIISQNLFNKAILQSGSVLKPDIYDIDPLENAKRTCEKLKCKSCENPKLINQCLKDSSLIDLLYVESEYKISYDWTFNDLGGVLPKDPIQLLMETTKEYQIMAGVMQNDGGYLINSVHFVDENNPDQKIITNFYAELDLINRSLSNKKKLQAAAMVDTISTWIIKSPLRKFLELYSNKHSNQNNYLYSMDYVGEHVYIPYITSLQQKFPYYPFVGGVHHANDLLYLFPTKNLNENDTEMAKTMIDLWTSFAINGKPVVKDGPEILPIKNAKCPYFHINKKITIGDDFSDEFLVAMKKLIFNN